MNGPEPAVERRTLRLLLKGNRDLADALLRLQSSHGAHARDHSAPVAGKYANRLEFDIYHETGGRADLLLRARMGVPPEVRDQGLECGDGRWITDQFESRLFDGQADVVVLALQPSITDALWMHRVGGYLFCPAPDWEGAWSPRQKQWLAETFVPAGLMRAQDFQECFRKLVQALKERSRAQILVLNCSSIDPADQAFRYGGTEGEPWSVRVHRFNVALLEISSEEGISIIDVDRIAGELGAARHVKEFLVYSEEASRAICAEALRVMEDLGVLEAGPGDPAETRWEAGESSRRLVMPFVNRMAQRGTVIKWHKKTGDPIRHGDDLADVRMRLAAIRPQSRNDRIRDQVEARDMGSGIATPGDAGASGVGMTVRITSMDTGFLARINAAEGCESAVGDVLAVITTQPVLAPGAAAEAGGETGLFKVVANIVS